MPIAPRVSALLVVAGLLATATPVPAQQPKAPSFEAVEGFYGALGRGDGIAAASYLVPEKRGRGHFSAAAMQRFYGGLARPLALRSVAPAGPDRVSVRYDFVRRDGGTCDGRAIVRVRPSAEGTLIETIRALSNC